MIISMKINTESSSELEGVIFKRIETHADDRGFFRELLRTEEFSSLGGLGQISHSKVFPGVLKAWHGHKQQYQWTYVISGSLHVALVDKRKELPTYNKSIDFFIGSNFESCIYGFPPGILHGYINLSETAEVLYLTSGQYDIQEELRFNPFDTNIPFSWKDANPPR